jgi:hypothetical protein
VTDSITPPPELVEQWCNNPRLTWLERLSLAYAAGADQELEACCEWLIGWDTCEGERLASLLREGRRPKPPSLKEQALAALGEMSIEPCLINGVDANAAVRAKYNTIRRALEALPE